MLKQTIPAAFRIVRASFRELGTNDPFRMAGATAFFTTFSLPAILMIIVRTLGIFSDRRTVGRRMGAELRKVIGEESMNSMLQAIRSFRSLQHNLLFSVGVFVFLLFVATTLFRIIKNSVNEIWNISVSPQSNLKDMLRSRAVSVAVMLLGGILFLSVQFIDTGRLMLGEFLDVGQASYMAQIGGILHSILLVLFTTLWFYVLFLFLPDGRPARGIAFGGAFVTAILFTVGKMILRMLLSPGRVNSFYGASGALVLVLLFMFYSSLILYYGAALIRAWSDESGQPVVPKKHAVRYRTIIET